MNLAGHKFGRLTVLEFARRDKRRNAYWLCRCDCGQSKGVSQSGFLRGDSKSCGGLKREFNAKQFITHGMHKTREYRAWADMINRCENKNVKCFTRYGGRGIQVCRKWKESFVSFYKDMGQRPENRSLDRINNDGNYEPGNCRWATKKEQANNRTSQGV